MVGSHKAHQVRVAKHQADGDITAGGVACGGAGAPRRTCRRWFRLKKQWSSPVSNVIRLFNMRHGSTRQRGLLA